MKNYYKIVHYFPTIYTYLGNNYIHECHMTCHGDKIVAI